MLYCSSCGNEVLSDSQFCPKCGSPIQTNVNSSNVTQTKRSNWWYLLPIFFSVVGGVIAYFVLRNDDAKLAKNCLYLGIILTIIGLIISVIFGAMSMMMMHRYY